MLKSLKLKKVGIVLLSAILLLPILFSFLIKPATRYCDDSVTATPITERLQYDYYVENYSAFTERSLQDFISYTKPNSCGITAGAIAVAYYDYEIPDLIPNYDPYMYDEDGSIIGNIGDSAETTQLKDTLWVAMGSRTDGVTANEFLTGLNTFATSKGHTFSHNTIAKDASMSTNCQNVFNNGKICAIFLDNYKFYSYGGFEINDNNYELSGLQKNAAHIAIASGIVSYSFFKDSKCIQTKTFFEVSFGDGALGYVDITDLGSVDRIEQLIFTA